MLTHLEPLKRSCGDCGLCCTLIPADVDSVHKPAHQKCKHRSFKGCRIYAELPTRALPCKLWSCRWLLNLDTEKLSRPDRSHYVIDLGIDYVTTTQRSTGEQTHTAVIQVWLDPKHPYAWRDPELLNYLRRRADEEYFTLVRTSANEAFLLLFDDDGEPVVVLTEPSQPDDKTHSAMEVYNAVGRVF